MDGKLATWAVAITALVCVGSVRAHHSIRMIETSTPIWITGTVVRYEIGNPHTMIELEERTEEGQVKRWTIEGPIPGRIQRMGVDASFLTNGAVIEVCGFPPKAAVSARRSTDGPPPYVHGHMLVMPDGRWQPWGPYGQLENCVRPGDQAPSWRDFLNADPFARELWCNRNPTPTIAAATSLADEVNRLLASPCQ